MSIIYHLAQKADWEAVPTGEEYRAPSLEPEGFIHCSQDEPQLLAVANRLFPGRDDFLVLEVETNRLFSPVKREPSRSGEIYPHIYGPINPDAVVKVRTLAIDSQGNFSVSEG